MLFVPAERWQMKIEGTNDASSFFEQCILRLCAYLCIRSRRLWRSGSPGAASTAHTCGRCRNTKPGEKRRPAARAASGVGLPADQGGHMLIMRFLHILSAFWLIAG